MMNGMDGRVVQQLSQGHRLRGATAEGKLHDTPEILVVESRQKVADVRFHDAP